VLTGAWSLKAALDLDWDDAGERAQALVRVLEALQRVEAYLKEDLPRADEQEQQQQPAAMGIARGVREQDVLFAEEEEAGVPVLRRGVARERVVSVEDPQMRHGRKSRSVRFSGYNRHVLEDLDTGLLRAVGVTPANAPEAGVTEGIPLELASEGASAGAGGALQGLAAHERRALAQDGVFAGLAEGADGLPGGCGCAVRAWRGGALGEEDVPGVPLAGALHEEHERRAHAT
jgi:hypothetical protein